MNTDTTTQYVPDLQSKAQWALGLIVILDQI